MPAAGQVTIDGRTYTKRHQVIPLVQTITVANSVTPVTLTLPGIAIFMLRALTRDVLVQEEEVLVPSTAIRFAFKLTNSDGSISYSTGGTVGGVGGTTDRVLDTLMFGNGQFPYVLDPFIIFQLASSLKLEIEDITGVVPYTIFFAFQGCWLLPSA